MSNPPQIIRVLPDELPQGARWQPIIGTETLELLDHLHMTGDSRERLLEQAASILARCIPPQPGAEHETGLVLGYVQSGKTMQKRAFVLADNKLALNAGWDFEMLRVELEALCVGSSGRIRTFNLSVNTSIQIGMIASTPLTWQSKLRQRHLGSPDDET